jgi:acyl-CoA reductase-like NAD-dependent aldehyde dehydrogenase
MSGFFKETELPQEEVDAIILEAAKRIKRYGMEMAAIMTLESLKPLVYVGGELTRLTLSPFFPVLGSTMDMWGEKLIDVFEERENIDKLILLLEKMSEEDYTEPSP